MTLLERIQGLSSDVDSTKELDREERLAAEMFDAGFRACQEKIEQLLKGMPNASVDPMPGAPGFTIAVFNANEVPAGTTVIAPIEEVKHDN